MNFPYKITVLMTITFPIVVLLLCGLSGASPVDNNNGDQEALLALLEHEINQEFAPNPQVQVPNDINNEHELYENSIYLGHLTGNDIDTNNIHENNQVMDNNNDNPIDMDDNNVPNYPQGLPEEHDFQFEINLDIGGLLRARSPDVEDDDPMDAGGPGAGHLLPDFLSMDNSRQNALPVTRDPQQLAEELREIYGVEMFNNVPEE